MVGERQGERGGSEYEREVLAMCVHAWEGCTCFALSLMHKFGSLFDAHGTLALSMSLFLSPSLPRARAPSVSLLSLSVCVWSVWERTGAFLGAPQIQIAQHRHVSQHACCRALEPVCVCVCVCVCAREGVRVRAHARVHES